MKVVGHASVLAARMRAFQRLKAAMEPRAAQETALFSLLARASRTEFGKAHGFRRIRNLADYRASVPLRRYSDLLPWLERALAGERDVVWPGRIGFFGMTSGTTAGNKYLPISADSIRQQRRGALEPLASYLGWTRDTTLFDGPALMLWSSTELEKRPSGVLVGDNTGIMARQVPRFAQSRYLPSPAVRKLSNWDEKIRAISREAVRADVRLVAGTPSWFPGLFDAVLAEAARMGRPAATVTDVWPKLRLLTGGGINYEPYRPLVESKLGRAIPYVETYNATEGGIMGVQDVQGDPSMLLLPDNGVFYEFVPATEIDAMAPRRYALWEVDLDVTYALAVSTMSGLFSYVLGDCVRFTSRFPHRFLFEGRTSAFLNVQGEHVSQGELERAIRNASTRLGVRTIDFTVGTDVGLDGGSAARHVYFVELEGPAPRDAHFSIEFALEVDRDIASMNDDYATHRAVTQGLRPPAVRVVPCGSFEEWMRRMNKLGSQNKVPRVCTAREKRELLERTARDLAARTAHPTTGNGARAKA